MVEYESTTSQPLCVAISSKAENEEQSPRTETRTFSQEQDGRRERTPQAAPRLSDLDIIKGAEWYEHVLDLPP